MRTKEVMRATLVLCEYAEELDGRLNLRGGVSVRLQANRQASVSAVVIVEASRFELRTEHAVVVRLLRRDSEPVLGDNGRPVGAWRKFLIDDSHAHLPVAAAPFVVSFKDLQLGSGVYRFVVEVDGQILDERWLPVAAAIDFHDELATETGQPAVQACSKCGQLLATNACPRCDRLQ
jgi:hypothetical protein